ncbi:MAG: hypothetical protein J0H17_06795 [Rhizobiales bacterium]|nr:hypothetical protein [Hyphomicrobiales bacterium]
MDARDKRGHDAFCPVFTLNADVEIGAEAVGGGRKLRAVLLRRFEKLRDGRLRIRVHTHHFRRDGDLNLRGLGAGKG